MDTYGSSSVDLLGAEWTGVQGATYKDTTQTRNAKGRVELPVQQQGAEVGGKRETGYEMAILMGEVEQAKGAGGLKRKLGCRVLRCDVREPGEA